MATSGEHPPTTESLLESYRERTRRLVGDLLEEKDRQGETDAARLVDMVYAAVLEETGWELRQILTHLRTRLELAQHRGEQDQTPLDLEEIEGLLGSIDRASALLEVSLDRDETAKHLIPVETEAFDLAETLDKWLHKEGLLPHEAMSFRIEPAPVRGDRVKLAKAIGTMAQRFLADLPEGGEVIGRVAWEDEVVGGFVGQRGGDLSLEALMNEISSPLPVGELRFDLALVRAIIERHDGTIQVHRMDDETVGFAFELPALDKEWI